jgi:hypothetical protein
MNSDRFWHWLARALPVRLRYWSVVVEGAHATCNVWPNRTPDEVSLIDLLKARNHHSSADNKPADKPNVG